MEANDTVQIIYLYGHYYISNTEKDEYLMIDMWNNKARLIDADCYEVVASLNTIKNELRNI